jgi:hypothetical protein
VAVAGVEVVSNLQRAAFGVVVHVKHADYWNASIQAEHSGLVWRGHPGAEDFDPVVEAVPQSLDLPVRPSRWGLLPLERGVSWLPDLWGDPSADEPVWRVEFQCRRPVLVDFSLRTVDEALAGLQDLWHYATRSWLTYRHPTNDQRVRRWPVDPIWQAVQAVRRSPGMLGVVRRRLLQANEERLVQGLQGYLSGLAALRGWRELAVAVERAQGLVEDYLRSRERTWASEVQRKAERLMAVTGWMDEEAA